jgi:hypothetical protein
MAACCEAGCLAYLGPMEVTCPTCFETFDVPEPHVTEVPCTVDYDCEVCCRPMTIEFWEEDGEVVGEAVGLAD